MSTKKLRSLPGFKSLLISDRQAIKKHLHSFPEYSDYNFTGMFCWDTQGQAQISFKHGNVAVILRDYTTGDPFISFSGNKLVNQHARELLALSQSAGFGDTLRLIPQIVIDHLSPKEFTVEEDRDNFDYILSVEHLSRLQGARNEDRRYRIKKFLANYGDTLEIRQLDIKEAVSKKEIFHCLDKWEILKGQTLESNPIERQAIKKLLDLSDQLPVICLALYIQGGIAAFSIFEILDKNYAIIHFEKCHTNFNGIASYLRHQVAARLEEEGISYINYEQDLGIVGLRKSKEMLHPTHFLKKYIISSKV